MLRGRVGDGNAPAVARYLSQRGAMIGRIVVVDDDERSISKALREALDRNPRLVVTTGGLGPSIDDRTLAAVADALGRPLALHPGAKSMVEASYRRLRERKLLTQGGLTAARERMCNLPVGCSPVENPVGVSLGVICRLPGGATVLCLPGMPDEMVAVLEAAMPLLKDAAPRASVAQREIESPTADESALRPLLEELAHQFPDLWINSHALGRRRGQKILITLESTGGSQKEAAAAVDAAVKRLLALAAGSP